MNASRNSVAQYSCKRCTVDAHMQQQRCICSSHTCISCDCHIDSYALAHANGCIDAVPIRMYDHAPGKLPHLLRHPDLVLLPRALLPVTHTCKHRCSILNLHDATTDTTDTQVLHAASPPPSPGTNSNLSKLPVAVISQSTTMHISIQSA